MKADRLQAELNSHPDSDLAITAVTTLSHCEDLAVFCSHHSDQPQFSSEARRHLSLALGALLISLFISAISVGCSESGVGQEGVGKASQSPYGYYEDPYEDPYSDPYAQSDNPWSEADLDAVEELLATDIGEIEDGDLTDGSALVAGPGAGVSVVLSCQEGVAYVTAGVATGVLATVLAASGVVAAGGGVAVTAPASVPVYATAGALIGFGLSSSSWVTCLGAVAQIGLGLIQNGYFSAARGIQSLVSQWSGDATRDRDQATSGAQSTTSTCRSGTRECNDMTGRYKNSFCNPLNRWRDRLGVDVHANAICDLGGLNCQEIAEVARLAAGCWRGRKAVTDRCFGGQADYGHKLATDYAEGDFFSCIDLSFDLGCGDGGIEDRLFDQAESAYPECL